MKFPYNDYIIGGLREDKNQSHDRRQQKFNYWNENPVAFEQQCEAEFDVYRECISRYRRLTGGNPDHFNWVMSPPGLQIVDWLVRCVPLYTDSPVDAIATVEQFMTSEHFRVAPCVFLQTRIFAKLAESASSRKFPRKPRASDPYDEIVLSVYAPYCDAVFIDGGFREIAIDRRIDCEKKFGVEIFAEQSRDSLLDYLDQIKQSTTEEHRKNLQYVHGD